MNIRILQIVITVCILALHASVASAAEVFVHAPKEVVIGSEFAVDIIIRAEEELVNASAGEVVIEGGEIVLINEAISDMPLWIEQPEVQDGKIIWSNMSPSGRSGDVRIMRVYIRAQQNRMSVRVQNVELYKHDGLATRVPAPGATFVIDGRVEEQIPMPASKERWEDRWSPEPFTIEVSYDQEMFEEAPVLIFFTTDKQSGINHYEAAFDDGEFSRVQSPLPFEKDIKKVQIKAIDRAGNERISTLAFDQQEVRVVFAPWLLLVASIIVCIGMAYVFFRRK